jgi:hypothetical protein
MLQVKNEVKTNGYNLTNVDAVLKLWKVSETGFAELNDE